MAYLWPQDVFLAMENGDLSVKEAFSILRDMDIASSGNRADTSQSHFKIEEILQELDSLIGLVEVKRLVREIYALTFYCKENIAHEARLSLELWAVGKNGVCFP